MADRSPLRSLSTASQPTWSCGDSGSVALGRALWLPILLLALLATSLSTGCREEKPAHEYGTVDMRMGSRTFRLEIAATESARSYGLMNRQSMPSDHGMIFVFGTEEPRAFWMKNTLIPLDLVYVNGSGTVVSIKHGVPLQETPTIPSDGPMKYAIELNDGAAAAAGVKPGEKLAIPAEAREPVVSLRDDR